MSMPRGPFARSFQLLSTYKETGELFDQLATRTLSLSSASLTGLEERAIGAGAGSVGGLSAIARSK